MYNQVKYVLACKVFWYENWIKQEDKLGCLLLSGKEKLCALIGYRNRTINTYHWMTPEEKEMYSKLKMWRVPYDWPLSNRRQKKEEHIRRIYIRKFNLVMEELKSLPGSQFYHEKETEFYQLAA